MKIFIILESHVEREIRGVTVSSELAYKICEMFKEVDLFVEEYETLEDKTLKYLLEVTVNDK